MSTLYTDAIQPNLESRVAIPGHVIQVVNADHSGITTVTSATWTDTPITLGITPTFASSKIAVHFTFPFIMYGAARIRGGFRLLRDSTVIAGGSDETAHLRELGGAYEALLPSNLHYVDSPNTTSEVTYKIQIILKAGTGVQVIGQAQGRPSHMSLMEIAQ